MPSRRAPRSRAGAASTRRGSARDRARSRASSRGTACGRRARRPRRAPSVPRRPRRPWPCRARARRASTSLIGMAGVGERKHAPTSVPPEQLMIGQRPPPTCSNNHRYGPGFQGSPVVTMVRSEDRSAAGSPFGMSARMSVGEQPRMLTCSSSISDQSRSSGQSGAPSMQHERAAHGAATHHRPRAHDPAHVGGEEDDIARMAVRLIGDLARNRDQENRPGRGGRPWACPVVPEVYVRR